ncbi:MAG: lipopolysaccharide biosynthesis protein [Betaproteobacteria bacterium]|nr:lipopolysaccharide biosynthesis protein [Betaproteobacteria bacterium]
MPESEIANDSSAVAPSARVERNHDEVSLLGLLVVVAKHKTIILAAALGASAIAALLSLLVANIYTATAKILPPQQSQSTAAAMLGQLGALSGLAGSGMGLKNPNDLYVAMLTSRTVADSLISRFDLQRLYAEKDQTATRARLASRSVISTATDQIITIAVEDEDPARAAAIANGYVDELHKLTKTLALTEASQRRLFFERQFVEARDNLAGAESSARQAMQKGGLAQVEGQARALLEITSRLRAQISVKEVQIGAMQAFAAQGNPELQSAQQELEVMRRELTKLEGGSPERSSAPGGQGSTDSVRALRNVRYYQTLYELLAKQFEMAKIDEARESSLVQVLDTALPPERKTRPKRALIAVMTFVVTFVLMSLAVLIREGLASMHSDPMKADQLRAIRRYLTWQSGRV